MATVLICMLLIALICSNVAFLLPPTVFGKATIRRPPNHCLFDAGSSARAVPHLRLAGTSSDSGGEAVGLEKKYLYAGMLVVFGLLWDYYVTHGGHPYLAHPPS